MDIAPGPNNSASATSDSVEFLGYYRQPSGCVEVSIQGAQPGKVDILHFCAETDAEAMVREFAAFVAHVKDWPRI